MPKSERISGRMQTAIPSPTPTTKNMVEFHPSPIAAAPRYQSTVVKKTPVSASKKAAPSSAKKKNKKITSPLYPWERPPDDNENSNIARRAVMTDYGQFNPSDRTRGFYEQQHQEVTNKWVDFQIVLSEMEYQELLAKRRARKMREKVSLIYAPFKSRTHRSQ